MYNKSGDDVYKQQMMDNFRFSSASIASSPNPIQQSEGRGCVVGSECSDSIERGFHIHIILHSYRVVFEHDGMGNDPFVDAAESASFVEKVSL